MQEIVRGDRAVTVLIGGGLLCLYAACWVPCVQADGGKRRHLEADVYSSLAEDEVQTCRAGGTLPLNGAAKDFQFKCDKGLNLMPVEEKPSAVAPGSRQGIDNAALRKVYLLGSQLRSSKVCGEQQGQLDKLVPQSALAVVNTGNHVRGVEEAQTVFKLTLGEGNSQDTQFCYTCKPAAAPDSPLESRTSPCTIFVTVPAKQEPQPPEMPSPEPDTQFVPQPDTQPAPQPTPQPDQPSEGGSFQPRVFGCRVLGVTILALGLTVNG